MCFTDKDEKALEKILIWINAAFNLYNILNDVGDAMIKSWNGCDELTVTEDPGWNKNN